MDGGNGRAGNRAARLVRDKSTKAGSRAVAATTTMAAMAANTTAGATAPAFIDTHQHTIYLSLWPTQQSRNEPNSTPPLLRSAPSGIHTERWRIVHAPNRAKGKLTTLGFDTAERYGCIKHGGAPS